MSGYASHIDDVERRCMFLQAVDEVRRVALRGHFHDTRNTAIANIVAALQAGVSRFDASVGGVGGVGGCPFAPAATGNVASEDVAYLLRRMGLPLTVDLQRLNQTAHWLGEKLGRTLPGMVSRAGDFPP